MSRSLDGDVKLEPPIRPVVDLVQDGEAAVVHRVPLEILRAIFKLAQGLVTLSDTEPPYLSVKVPVAYYSVLAATTRVCRRWRDIITGTPELWATLCFPKIQCRSLLQLALRYSGSAPLRVVYDANGVQNSVAGSPDEEIGVQEIVETVLAESTRIRELHVQVAVMSRTLQAGQAMSHLLWTQFPALRVYHIFFPTTMERQIWLASLPSFELDFALDATAFPALEELRLHNRSRLPWDGICTLSTLKVLHIMGSSNMRVAYPGGLSAVLGGLPSLEILRVELSGITEEPTEQSTTTPVSLDKLTLLQLVGERSKCARFLRHLKLPHELFLEVKYPEGQSNDVTTIVEPLLSLFSNSLTSRTLSTLALFTNFAHYRLCGWRNIIPETCGTLANCRQGAGFRLDVGWGGSGSLMEAAQRLPINDVRELIVRPYPNDSKSPMFKFDAAADLALSATSMPNVESLWLYPTRIAPVNLWMAPLSTPMASTGECPWPALKTLVLRNTRYHNKKLVVHIRDALMKREAAKCARLERLVIARSFITDDRIDLLRPYAKQVVTFANHAEISLKSLRNSGVHEEFEPFL